MVGEVSDAVASVRGKIKILKASAEVLKKFNLAKVKIGDIEINAGLPQVIMETKEEEEDY